MHPSLCGDFPRPNAVGKCQRHLTYHGFVFGFVLPILPILPMFYPFYPCYPFLLPFVFCWSQVNISRFGYSCPCEAHLYKNSASNFDKKPTFFICDCHVFVHVLIWKFHTCSWTHVYQGFWIWDIIFTNSLVFFFDGPFYYLIQSIIR